MLATLGFLVVELAAQLLPFPGVLLMVFGAALWSIPLLNAVLILMTLDAVTSRERRLLIFIPAAVYTTCFLASLQADQAYNVLAKQLSLSNASALSLSRHGEPLIFPNPKASQIGYFLAAEYMTPTVYTFDPDRVSGWTLNSVEPQSVCDKLQDRDDLDASALNRVHEIMLGTSTGTSVTSDDNRCMVRQRAAPPASGFILQLRKDASGFLLKKDLSIYLEGNGASLQMGKVGLFPPLPLFVAGCALVDGGENAGWRCIFQPLYRYRKVGEEADTVLGQTRALAARLRLRPRPVGSISPSEVFDAVPAPAGGKW